MVRSTLLRRRAVHLTAVLGMLTAGTLVSCADQGGTDFSSVHAGGQHTCAIDTTGAAWCWGANRFGQLGDGTNLDHERPVKVAGDLLFASLDLGLTHTCGVDTDGSAWCWGGNFVGKLGDGTTEPSPIPVQVRGLPGPVELVVASSDRSCAVTDGSLWCWGDNTQNVMGIDTRGTLLTATLILPSGVVSHAMSAGKSCTLAERVLCVGIDVDGEQPVDAFAGVAIEGLSTVEELVEIVGAQFIFCGRSATGRVMCWGNLAWNIDPDGTWVEGLWLRAVEIPGTKAERLTTMDATICMLETGQVVCRGGLPGQGWVLSGTSIADAGKLGAPWVIPFPGNAVLDVSGGSSHICAVVSGGEIWCSGSNAYGQLGDGSRNDALAPVKVSA